jgi:hypothetical protein
MNGLLINKRGIDTTKWKNILEDIKLFLDCLPSGCEISGANGEGAPTFSKNKIVFNGAYPNQGVPVVIERYFTSFSYDDKMHTPYVVRAAYFITRKKPYDIFAKCVMLSCAHHAEYSMKIFSDQSFVDWKPAMSMYEYATEREVSEKIKNFLRERKLKRKTKKQIK